MNKKVLVYTLFLLLFSSVGVALFDNQVINPSSIIVEQIINNYTTSYTDTQITVSESFNVENGASGSKFAFYDDVSGGGYLQLDDYDGDLNVMFRSYGESYLKGGRVGILTSTIYNNLSIGELESSASVDEGTVGIKANSDGKNVVLQEYDGAEQWEWGVSNDGNLSFYDSGSSLPSLIIEDITDKTTISGTIKAEGSIYAGGDTAPAQYDDNTIGVVGDSTPSFTLNDTGQDLSYGIFAFGTRMGVRYGTSTGEIISFDNNNKVGINNTYSPSVALDVKGAVRADGFIEYSYDYIGENPVSVLRNIQIVPNSQKGNWAEVNHTTLPIGVKEIILETKYVEKQTDKEWSLVEIQDNIIVEYNITSIYNTNSISYMWKDSRYESVDDLMEAEFDIITKEVMGRSLNKGIQLNSASIRQIAEEMCLYSDVYSWCK